MWKSKNKAFETRTRHEVAASRAGGLASGVRVADLLILGRGKTGSAVAEVARERGHHVRILSSAENANAQGLTAELLTSVDVVIDFTTREAVLANLRALLPLGAKVVVGTTGWYAELPALSALAKKHDASLLYGTNFSLGVQAFFRAAEELARSLPDYELSIEETHHVTKKDAPSGTALTLQQVVEQVSQKQVQIVSHREGDAAGLHVLALRSPSEILTLRHEAFSRIGFATGAVRAAEWIFQQDEPGSWDFAKVAALLG
jgi:4-hydroxy-tetrahydrodipicolinate reductase